MYPQPEPGDGDEAARVWRTLLHAARLKIIALTDAACCKGSFERDFLAKPVDYYDQTDIAILDRLAWHYRRRMPRHLRPSLLRHDPVARELNLEKTDVFA